MDQGIPHSEFLKWSEEDQDKVIGYLLYRASLCSQCGTDPDEWLEDGQAVEPPPYDVGTRVCLGCATLEERRDELPKDRRSFMQTYFVRTRRSNGRRTHFSRLAGRL